MTPLEDALRSILLPTIQAHSSDKKKIVVINKKSEHFECDRYCPHGRLDLQKYGKIYDEGGMTTLLCPAHGWMYNIEDGGQTNGHYATINACKINDW